MATRPREMIFEVHVKIDVRDDGRHILRQARGKFKRTIIANRQPVHTIQCRGTLKINPEGIEFLSDKEPML